MIASSPPPRRPTTTDMVAKRLVHGALGVKVAKSPEQKIAEKQMLQAARGKPINFTPKIVPAALVLLFNSHIINFLLFASCIGHICR